MRGEPVISMLRYLEPAVMAFVSFGPLFLVVEPRRPEWTKALRMSGVLMVSVALLVMWLTIYVQRGELSLLQTRVEALENRDR